ncbi:MAG: hypothetical protein V4639_04255 [Pseudomonadota bacterium]|nr:hypothetical protein [Polaromonas sp.]MDO9259365.1 hypothetical protein [Polaromonas sp.]
MNLTLNSALLEKMVEGVIFLNGEGQITDFNRSSRPWLKCTAGVAPQLAQLLGQVASGAVLAPVDITALFGRWTSEDQVDVYLCKSDTQAHALLFLPLMRQASVPLPGASANVLTLLGQELRHELTLLRQQADIADPPAAPDKSSVIGQSGRLSRLLVAMDQLLQLSGIHSLFPGSRLALGDLIDEVLIEVPRPQGGYRVEFEPGTMPTTQGALYGDADWLKCALRGLVEAIGENAPPTSAVELRIRQRGASVELTGNLVKAGPVRRAAFVGAAQRVSLRLDPDTRLPICRRIVELHGGQLEALPAPRDDADKRAAGVQAFTLTLPLGDAGNASEPSASASRLFVEQAELYARDLASLMRTLRVGADASPVCESPEETASPRVSVLPLKSQNENYPHC